MTRAAFVVGLAAEARVLERAAGHHDPALPRRIACVAASSARAGQEAERLLAEGAGALVSFGIAGGLDPVLMPGDLVLAERIHLPEGGHIETAAPWRGDWTARAAEAGLRSRGGTLAGSPRVVTPAADKRRLFESSGACAVDMESHAVARVAEAAGVPFLAVRAVADPSDSSLPSVVRHSLGPDGRERRGVVAARLTLRPWQLPDVLRLRRDMRAALATLGRLVRLLGPDALGPPAGS
jgi:adenosylhomocysteine nucleosidase